MQTLTVIIPCYNEEAVVDAAYERVRAVLDLMERDCGLRGALLFVNDGSSDGTAQMLNARAKKDERVQVVHLSRNFGHQAALSAGISFCHSDYAVVMDADLQDPPEVIPEMWRLMQEHEVDVVYGVRRERKGDSWFKRTTAKVFYRVLNGMSDFHIPVDTGDFRLMKREVLDAFRQLPEHNKYIRGLISWMGFTQMPYEYNRQARVAGETKYSLGGMVSLALNAMQYFSNKPLRLAMSLGYIAVLLAVLLGLWVFLGKLLGLTHPETGWSSIIVVLTFFAGVQLICLGMLSNYVATIFDEVKRRPEYIVARTINIDEQKNKDSDRQRSTTAATDPEAGAYPGQ